MSQTALVNVDAEAITKLSSFIAELTGDSKADFTAQCANISQPAVLLQTLLNKTDLILALENEKDVEGCFQAIIAILHSTVTDSTEEQDVIRSLIDRLTASDNATCVLRVFVSILNILRSASAKFEVLKALLCHAIKSKQASLVAHFEVNVSAWVANWSLTVSQQRELYVLMADTLFATGQEYHSRALFFLTQFLTTFKTGEVYPQEVVAVATRAIVSAVRAPVSLYKDRNLLSKTMAGHSTTDPTLVRLMQLLDVFCSGSVDEFVKFHSSNKDLFAEFNVCYDTSLKSMRLLGLCVLAARTTSSSSQVLTYSDIARTLEVNSDEEVEEWVVEAISHGLMEASMDQLNGAVVVSRCVRVSFDKQEWVTLQQKLSLWRNNLASVLDMMRSHQNKQ